MHKVIQIYTKFKYLKFWKLARGPYCFLGSMSFIIGFWLSVQLGSHADFNIFLFCLEKSSQNKKSTLCRIWSVHSIFLRSCSLDWCRCPREEGHERLWRMVNPLSRLLYVDPVWMPWDSENLDKKYFRILICHLNGLDSKGLLRKSEQRKSGGIIED